MEIVEKMYLHFIEKSSTPFQTTDRFLKGDPYTITLLSATSWGYDGNNS
jgi:hypothetical protein